VESKYGQLQKWGLVVHQNAKNLQASHRNLGVEYLALVRATRPLLAAMSDVEAAFGAVFKTAWDQTRAELCGLVDPQKVEETLEESQASLEISSLNSLLLPDDLPTDPSAAQPARPRSASQVKTIPVRQLKKPGCYVAPLAKAFEPVRYVPAFKLAGKLADVRSEPNRFPSLTDVRSEPPALRPKP
jgi:hypothetical protein